MFIIKMESIVYKPLAGSPDVDIDVLEETSVDLDELLDNPKCLIVYNDDVNTFDHVIETLIKVCRHDPVQAEQCTFIIHFNGKCPVKHGSFKELRPMCEAILERGISAKIED
jgi:ATP-dependent Clp protease adaptor protein ClpS